MDEAEPCHGCKKVPKKKTARKKKKATKKFKNRGGSKFTVSVNGNKQHDIILAEVNLGGVHKMAGETDPFAMRDLYRAVLFFMWGIPLDHPVDKATDKKFKKAIDLLKKAEPELYTKHCERIAGLK